MSELTSQLLVAMPQLDDPNFKRSVVLLVHHGQAESQEMDFILEQGMGADGDLRRAIGEPR